MALFNGHTFTLRYEGITTSIITVMVQEPGLNQLRAIEIGDGLDRRYAIETAYQTVLRFSSRPEDMPQFMALPEASRVSDFVLMTFDKLQLIKNDLFMSADKFEILAEYSLA